jgi:hypothetical protein
MEPPIERLDQTAQRFNQPRLHNRSNPLRSGRLVRQIVQCVEHVRPRLVLRPALRDSRRKLRDLRGDPAIIVPGVQDRKFRRIGAASAGIRHRGHAYQATNRPISPLAEPLRIRQPRV